jgi:hypothetical protein
MKKLQQAVRLFAAILVFAACAKATQGSWTELKPEHAGGPTFHLTGTVSRLDIEGGLWVIKSSDGDQYNTLNLPQEFQVEGTAVEADARRRENVVSNPAVGPKIDILRIRRR